MSEEEHKSDPATFEIIKNGLYKIAEEMRVVLAKTAYSPLLKSAGDYSCGIFDAGGEMVAAGKRLDLSKIKQDAFVLAAIDDHIAPWRSQFKTVELLGGTT